MASPNAGKMSFCIEWCNAQPSFGVQDDSDWQHLVHKVRKPTPRLPRSATSAAFHFGRHFNLI